MHRVAVLIDGFNLYHSLEDAISEGAPPSIKWLDLWSLSKHLFVPAFGKEAELIALDYCTSIQTNKRDASSRHKAYIRALSTFGSKVTYGQFKEKEIDCRAACKMKFRIFVEKRTDVVVASKLLEHLFTDTADSVVVVSGDTDLVPAFELAKRLFKAKGKNIGIAFPYNRKNHEFFQYASPRFELKIEDYKKFRLSEKLFDERGREIFIPPSWKP